jgi:hypothetical protein
MAAMKQTDRLLIQGTELRHKGDNAATGDHRRPPSTFTHAP